MTKFCFCFYRGKLIQSENKTHVIIGDTQFIIMLHEIKGRTFLWPVFSQVSGDKVEGFLGKSNILFVKLITVFNVCMWYVHLICWNQASFEGLLLHCSCPTCRLWEDLGTIQSPDGEWQDVCCFPVSWSSSIGSPGQITIWLYFLLIMTMPTEFMSTCNFNLNIFNSTDILDYSWSSAPRTQCWLTSAENALEGRLSDFVVTDL